MKEQVEEFLSNQSKKVKAKIRTEAMKKAEENCIRYGKKIEDFTLEEWKKLVSEEEEEIIRRVWKFGSIGAIAFGFMPWW